MSTSVLAFRSAVFAAVLWLTVLIYAPLSLLVFFLPQMARYRFISQWSHFNVWALRWICGIRFSVTGLEHLPLEPAIIAANHQSAWETLAFQVIFPPQSWVLKRELLFIPLFGWALALTLPIAIDRRAGRRALDEILRSGKNRLDNGRWVVIFPEGTRRPPGTIGRFGLGAALLARHTGRPIVPVAHNAGRFWPRAAFLKRPGTVRVMIGPPISPEGTPEEINGALQQWIGSRVAEI